MARTASPEQVRQAQVPHELLLFNLVFNHVFLFIVLISAPSLPFLPLAIPLLSVAIIVYTLWSARSAAAGARSVFVQCHWRLAARATHWFVGLWAVIGTVIGLVYLAAGGVPKPVHYAVGSLVFIPGLLAMLVIIILESEALQHARAGSLPRRAIRLARASGREPLQHEEYAHDAGNR